MNQPNVKLTIDQEFDAIRNRMKYFEDKVDDVRGAKSPDALHFQFNTLSTMVENYTIRIKNLEKMVKNFMDSKTNIKVVTNEELRNAWLQSGLTLDEISKYLNMKGTDRSVVSRLVNGQIKDIWKRYLAYRYCIEKIMKDQESENDL